MSKDNELSRSIDCFINSTMRSQQIKICMNPINYLKGLKNSDHFEIVDCFCKSDAMFHVTMQHIQNMFIMGYINYSNDEYKDVKGDILYRIISKGELEYLKENGFVSEFFSTFKHYEEEAKNYISYTHPNDDNNYLLSLSVTNNMPSIDTFSCANPQFETDEVILIPSFKINNLKEIYNDNNLITMSADICPNIVLENISYSTLLEAYKEIVKDIDIYGRYIEQYLLDEHNNLFESMKFINWATKLKEYIDMLNKYIGYNVLENELNINNYQKLKVI